MSKTNENTNKFIQEMKQKHKLDCFLGLNREKMASLNLTGHPTAYDIDEDEEFSDILYSLAAQNGYSLQKDFLAGIKYILRGHAIVNAQKKQTFVRYARDPKISDKLYVHTYNSQGEIYEVDELGYRLNTNCPFVFENGPSLAALPTPIAMDEQTFVVEIQKFLNLRNTNDYLPILAFCMQSMYVGNGAYPILILTGQKGSGKTSATEFIKKLVAPASPNLDSPPNDEDALIGMAYGTHLVAIDNAEQLVKQMVPYFCRMSTGGGLRRRSKYRNKKGTTINLKRPCIFNGINPMTTKEDFHDRTYEVKFKTMSKANRKRETQLLQAFEAIYPSLFGGLLGLLSKTIKELNKLANEEFELERMTEFMIMGIALERVLKLKDGTFLSVVNNNFNDKRSISFWENELCCSIYDSLAGKTKNSSSYASNQPNSCLKKDSQGHFYLQGSASELIKFLFKGSLKRPHTPQEFKSQLRNAESLLLQMGIELVLPQ